MYILASDLFCIRPYILAKKLLKYCLWICIISLFFLSKSDNYLDLYIRNIKELNLKQVFQYTKTI